MAYVELTGIDGVPLVGVNDNTEEARVGVDELGLEADLQVVEDRGVVQVSQVSHVFALLELWRVDLSNLLGLEHFFLKGGRTFIMKMTTKVRMGSLMGCCSGSGFVYDILEDQARSCARTFVTLTLKIKANVAS